MTVPLAAAVEVVAALRRSGGTVATAESITGGLVVAALTAVPGASMVVRGGLIVYATDLKAELARVPSEVLERDGPVAATTAAAMAAGACDRCHADFGVATTGVAGPDPQAGLPPGTLHLAVAGPRGNRVESYGELSGDRAALREHAVRLALDLLLAVVTGPGNPRAGPRVG